MKKSVTLYLASQSLRRKKLLKAMGIEFTSIVPDINEEVIEDNPIRYAQKLARDKVVSVASTIKHGIIIGVDTVVVIGNEILGKPRDKNEARIMMEKLSGKEHIVISGLCIMRLPGRKMQKISEKTVVRFRKLKPQEITSYINSYEPYDKAGGYGIQGKAGFFVESIDGCYYNVVGLPISKLLTALREII